ncbi:class-III pyridoxal-phosphate-dependent aminotransferase [Pseudomonas sp. HK3]|jgi:4-aminobutyrate aminotransferase-like enzyme
MSNQQRTLTSDAELNLMASGITPGYASAPYQFSYGNGVYLYDKNDNDYIDFCAGTFTNSIGHAHPVAVKFMQARLAELWNVHDYSTPLRLTLLRQLDALTPVDINTFQFYTGGSETIEAGLRALKSFLPESKKSIVSFSQAYHGKTLAARQLWHCQFPGETPADIKQLPFPDKFGLSDEQKPAYEQRCLDEIEVCFANDSSIGAVIFEPILGAGGNLQGSQWFWQAFSGLCDTYSILKFIDEICVGFGRTGYDFAFQRYAIEPDLIAFAKGLGGGFPAMCLAGKKEIMNATPFGERGGASTTFGGNPLSIAAMHITIKIYNDEKLAANALGMEPLLRQKISELASRFNTIADFRVSGLMATLQLNKGTPEDTKAFSMKLHQCCLAQGVKVMTFDHLFRIAPPLNITAHQLEQGIERMSKAFDQAIHESATENPHQLSSLDA